MSRASSAQKANAPADGRVSAGRFWLSKRRNSEAWCITWFDADTRQTKRESTGTSDLAAAFTALKEKARLDEGQAPIEPALRVVETPVAQPDTQPEITVNAGLDPKDPRVVLLHDAIDYYWETYAFGIASADTCLTWLGYWKGYFDEEVTISQLDRETMDGFVAHLRDFGLKESTINSALIPGRAAINRYRDYGKLLFGPKIRSNLNGQPYASIHEPKGRPLSIQEVARMYHAQRHPHMRLFMDILINTMCRPNAVSDLTAGQVSFEDNLIDLNPPGRAVTKKRRAILPITPSLKEALVPVLAARSNPTDRLLMHRGKPVLLPYQCWKTAKRKAGFADNDNVVPYSIRHTMARELRRMKIAPEEVSLFLGHVVKEGSRTTEIYAPFEPDYLSDAAEAVNDYAVRLKEEVRKLG